MKKHLLTFVVAVMAFCATFVSCQKENSTLSPDAAQYVGVYDLYMVYDSVSTSDGTWVSEEDYEFFTQKVNPPESGYLTISEGDNGKLNVTATFVKADTGVEKNFFTTTATEKDGLLVLDNCTSDYYYASIEDYIRFEFRNFVNNMPTITFKGIYTINLGADYSYLNSYTCTKRK